MLRSATRGFVPGVALRALKALSDKGRERVQSSHGLMRFQWFA